MEQNPNAEISIEQLVQQKQLLLKEISYYDDRVTRYADLFSRNSYIKATAKRQAKIQKRLSDAKQMLSQSKSLLEQIIVLLNQR